NLFGHGPHQLAEKGGAQVGPGTPPRISHLVAAEEKRNMLVADAVPGFPFQADSLSLYALPFFAHIFASAAAHMAEETFEILIATIKPVKLAMLPLHQFRLLLQQGA